MLKRHLFDLSLTFLYSSFLLTKTFTHLLNLYFIIIYYLILLFDLFFVIAHLDLHIGNYKLILVNVDLVVHNLAIIISSILDMGVIILITIYDLRCLWNFLTLTRKFDRPLTLRLPFYHTRLI